MRDSSSIETRTTKFEDFRMQIGKAADRRSQAVTGSHCRLAQHPGNLSSGQDVIVY
jgi:hypothetical protein